MKTMPDLKFPDNFITNFIDEDIAAGKAPNGVKTRFPPEPNGYLHIGHVKAFSIDFAIAERYGGTCNLRFDDTNPRKEEIEFVDAIKADILSMGYRWDAEYYASDFFEKLYEIAIKIIARGDAYVDDLTPEEMRAYRGTLTTPGKNSPYRDRSVEENLDLFKRMRAGEFADGSRVLRAKIDMSSPNMNLRDPALYRIMRVTHHRSGDAWCIYPMYDFQHPTQDALEGITHSLCSLEYEAHRPLYDWVVRAGGFTNPPRQIEFARLNITRTRMSKRYLRAMVEGGIVMGWDDPRMPTLVGMKRRGIQADAIKDFIYRVGVAKADSTVEYQLLEACARESLSASAPRAMAVLEPLKVTFCNWPADRVDEITEPWHPDKPELGARVMPFMQEIYIERADFMEDPPKKFFRLAPGREVRLKGAYIIKCEEVIKDDAGNVVELICSVDLSSKSGEEGANRKVKGTLHWVSAQTAVNAEIRLFEPLLAEENIADEGDDTDEIGDTPLKNEYNVNRDSFKIRSNAKLEPALSAAKPGDTFQFMRVGYFACDKDSTGDAIVFNRTVALKDSYKPE